MQTTTTLSTGARYLKRGDTRDPEDHRMTHRLHVASSILASQGITPTWPEHLDGCIKHENNRSNRVFGYEYQCDAPACPWRNNPAPTWPEWATDELFNQAFELASTIQDERGGWHQVKASEAKAAR